MDAARWEQVQELFMAALDRDPQEWGVFLDEACGDDAALRTEVDAMLRVHEDGQALAIEGRLFTEDPPRVDPEALLGTHIGPYRIQRLLGRGGMGDVYLAERDDAQYRQQVALKLVRPGFGTSYLLARFRTERQILARLIHPYIARLLDGGMTDEGRPYLVMQYIEGVPLTLFCNTHRLSVESRLRLFRQVCDAVQFAHRNLVVHRDLKPSNILVTDQGEVRLLDFGIAKLLDPEAIDVSAPITHSEMRVMTPEYAAPEQVRGEAITTATDVYALGVLLYELLTDHRPYRLAKRLQTEIERIICEEEPKRPSTAVTVVEEIRRKGGIAEMVTPGQVSAARGVPVGRLQRLLRGDLDNIVMMTLRKEPARRYASAEQLSEDLGRYLDGRPVMAQKDTVAYRIGKFVHRHRVGVLMGLGVLILGVLFGVLYTVHLARERDRAQQEASKSEQVVQVLVDLFETSNPDVVPGGDTLRVGAFLEQGRRQMLDALADQPVVQARMKQVLGSMYMARSQYGEARTVLEDALAQQEALTGPYDPDAVRTFHQLARLTLRVEDSEKAIPLLRESLARHWQAHGEGHLEVARAMQDLAIALPELEALEERDRLLTQALSIRRRLLPERHLDIAESLHYLGIHRQRMGDQEEGGQLLREALAMFTDLLGDRHPRMLRTLREVINIMEDPQEKVATLRHMLAVHREVYGNKSTEVAEDLNDLAVYLVVDQGRFEEGIAAFDEALTLWKDLVGVCHWEVANTARNFAITLEWDNRDAEALQTMAEAVDIVRCARGPEEQQTGYFMIQHSPFLLKLGRQEEALHYAREGVRILRKVVPEGEDYTLVEGLTNLGAVHVERGQPEVAEPLLREALNMRERWLGLGSPQDAVTQHWLGRTLVAQGRYAEAEPLLRQSYDVLKDRPGRPGRFGEETRRHLVEVYTVLGRPEEAAKYRE